jgi:hypothetical protein
MVKIDILVDPDEKPSGKRPEVADVVVRSAMEDEGRDPNVLTREYSVPRKWCQLAPLLQRRRWSP